MMAMVKPLASASSARPEQWEEISWPKVQALVFKLQMRIAKAIRNGHRSKAKALQRILTTSYYAKLLAVKRVTKNTGSKTPGVDGVVWKMPEQKLQAAHSLKRRGYKPLPLKRIYIPKQNSKKLRPLSIPTMYDRAQQALHLLGLEPIAEVLADHNAYGFRPRRAAGDAIEQCFNNLAKKTSAQWILEGDIKSCFNMISHKWLLDNIIMDKIMLKKWLNAGYMEKRKFYTTDTGISQGGIISPTILNLTLAGLEKTIKKVGSKKDKIHLVNYADDFIVSGTSKEVLENIIKPVIEKFLLERGLELSQEKTEITHIERGFNFLGFNIRKYGKKLLIKPQKQRVINYLRTIRKQIKTSHNINTRELIEWLNPKITGWANYYQHVVAKRTFSYVDHIIFWALWRWCRKKHRNKSVSWIIKRYYRHNGLRKWNFYAKVKDNIGKDQIVQLVATSDTVIKRHIKIRAKATIYDPKYKEYFEKRKYFKSNKAVAGKEARYQRIVGYA